ncbi:acyl-CoA desaturase [Micromonospora sp. A3M-1-15]|uniref:fatty acid desaturase family protein n=1 Tax=Micromonospora sp. A3M-1-15 TaxID=2962035 RepID=UPI0020B67EFF|nr:acyl-CoA desaturase [Micromonospora sp. A3M-1-15]MCP3783440.1 acyl-CoA desaturase [Micromonospora sp. A3M-1-15]
MSDTSIGAERQRGSAYADLSRQVRAAGLLERRQGHYAVRIGLVVGSYAGLWALFVSRGESWWQLAVAVALAVVFAQAGFIGHDAGHRQIARSRRANNLIGILHGNLLTGISYGWWVDKHNRHHAHPNTEGRDPDISVAPLSFTAGQARRRGGLGALFVRHQAYLFFPLLLLEGLHLHANSVRAVLRPRPLARRPAEAGLLALHLGGYLTTVFLVLSPAQAVAFILVNQAVLGLYLGCSFAPNHKGMPILGAEDNLDYLRRQVLTSRNVRGGKFVDTALGGLNYQIEHHLFPSMPCPNLRHARPLIRRFCAEHDLDYHETTLGRSWAEALRHLDDVGSGDPRSARPTSTRP